MTFLRPEIVLAPGGPDSGFSLSYPHENELINSIIKVKVYSEAVFSCRWLVEQHQLGLMWRQELTTSDFRKELYIKALWGPKSRPFRIYIHGQPGLLKYVHGTRLARSGWSQRGDLNVDEFECLVATLGKVRVTSKIDSMLNCQLTMKTVKTIEDERRAGIIRPYSPQRNPLSVSGMSFHGDLRGRMASGLYLVGRGSRAIFWFWEIEYDNRCYHEFQANDLAKGEKIYCAEEFDSWVTDDSV